MVESDTPLSVTLDEIAGITAERQPVIRNLRITDCYHDLSRRLSRVVCGTNVNWSTFATWASRTAGVSIRDEELPRHVMALLRDEARLRPRLGPVLTWIYRHTAARVDLFEQARDTVERVGQQVAEGNLKVFAELAPLFARFIDLMQGPADGREERLRAFLDTLRPGSSDRDGQDELRQAFSNYAAAAREADAARRAELILLGNCRIGLHEQTRLQDNIKAAMDAPIAVIVTDGIGRLISVRIAFVVLWPFGVRRLAIRTAIQDDWERLATRHSMTLSLPDGRVLSLGALHVPWPDRVPECLRTLRNPELIALLNRFGVSPEARASRGAEDWSDLGQRMAFICELFRAEQQSAPLFGPPFSAEARDAIARGVVPTSGI